MKIVLIAVMFSFAFSSCAPVSKSTTTSSGVELLTGKQWFYKELYIDATAPRTGTLIYKRGGSKNSQNRDLSRAIFWQDGTFDGLEPYEHTKMQWSFANNENTEYKMIWPGGSTRVNIIQLTENTFEWFNPEQRMSAVMFSKN